MASVAPIGLRNIPNTGEGGRVFEKRGMGVEVPPETLLSSLPKIAGMYCFFFLLMREVNLILEEEME